MGLRHLPRQRRAASAAGFRDTTVDADRCRRSLDFLALDLERKADMPAQGVTRQRDVSGDALERPRVAVTDPADFRQLDGAPVFIQASRDDVTAPRAGKLVDRVLGLGEVARGDVPAIVGEQERTARSILSRCGKAGYLKSTSPKGPVRIAFSVRDRASLFPGLFGDEPLRDPLSRETGREDGGNER